jgi:hypothetical protein
MSVDLNDDGFLNQNEEELVILRMERKRCFFIVMN